MKRKYVLIFSILVTLTIISGVFFNASLLDTSPPSLSGEGRIFVGDLCEKIGNGQDISDKIIQFENKILSINSYDQNDENGSFNCISSNLIEPFVVSESFTCQNNKLSLTGRQNWRIRNKCRSFTPVVVNCSQFNDEFTNNITRVNYTRFKYNDRANGLR